MPMLPTMTYLVIARHGQDRRDVSVPSYEAPRLRVPVAPEHLFRTGKGLTLCGLRVDETWERFPAQDGRLSPGACPECRALREAEQPTL
jgi:hypothetical protein